MTEHPQCIDSKYTIKKKLGGGGFSEVYLVEGPDGESALKLLHEVSGSDAAAALDEFKNEFSILKNLNHPHIARILDFGYDDAISRYYYTTEFIDGKPIFEATDGLNVEEVTDLVVQALRALAYLHSSRINHFDIKSTNVLVVPGSPPIVKIIDFGLAGIDPRGRLIGTPSYMSPEIINREPADWRSDLYSLAVLWYFCLARTNPFRTGKPRDTMQNQVRMTPPPPSSFDTKIPVWTDAIVLRLLQKNPAKRFAQAMHVVREINRFSEKKYPLETRETLTSYLPQEGELIGRVDEMKTIRAAFHVLEENKSRCTSVLVQGARGCGKTRFVHEFKYEAQLEEMRVTFANAAVADEYVPWRQDLTRHINEGSGIGIFILDNIDVLSSDEAAVQELMQLISRAQRPAGDASVMLVLTTSTALDDPFIASLAALVPARVVLQNFSAAEMTAYLASLTGLEEPPAGLVDEIMSRTNGNPLFVTEILKALIAGGGLFDEGGRWKATVFEDVGVDYSKVTMPETVEEMLLAGIRSLSADEQLLLKSLAVANTPSSAANLAHYTAVEDPFAHLRMLVQLDLLERDDQHRYNFRNDLVRQALYTAMPDEERVRFHDRIAETLEAEGASFEEVAHHVSFGSDVQRAADASNKLGERYLKRGLGRKAAGYLARAATMVPEENIEARVDILLKQGEALLISRDYKQAEELFSQVEQSLARLPDSERAVQRQVETLVRLGGVYMKLSAFSRARAAFTEAKVKLKTQPPDPVRTAHVENFLGSVLMHEGRYHEAQKVFERTRVTWRELSLDDRVRVTNNDLGMVLLAQRELKTAREAFEEDKAFADQIGHDLLIARARYNLAQLAVAEQKPEDAIAQYKQCTEVCKRSKNTELLLRAYNGLGTIYHMRGELNESIAYYERGLALHERAGDMRGGAAINVNIGIIQNSRGKFDEALDALVPAVEFLRGLRDKTAADWAALARGLLELGDVYKNQSDYIKAETCLHDAQEVATAHESAAGNRFWILLTMAEVARDKGDTENLSALIAQMRPLAANDAERKQLDELANELSTSVASISKAVRDEDASESVTAEPKQQRSSPFEKVLEINKLINAERDLDYVLKTVIYYAIELAGAESGAIILVNDAGKFSVACHRNMDGREDEVAFSTTLARRVLMDGVPVITDDALADERFANEQSIAAHGLRSIMCYPIRARGKVVGVMYLDHRFSMGAFADVDMKLIDAFADQAGLAIENARLMAEFAQRKDDLSAELSAASVRLERYEEMLKERGAFEPEKDYGVLATGSRAMQETLRILDRVADTDISILVMGESGVGKELIARALHANNTQRRNARFVAINCAAIPMNLLESELFGYKAGAFTGARRDKKGLLEEAEGGTLFFDEIAELDPSLQVKLLRVLQEREFMPVGGTKSKKCDVRVIAATNRDIDQEVKDGNFREDLFYRLCQVKVVIPPLRDRPEDIPQLVKQFVDEFAGDRAIEFDGALMKRMLEYSWPGNVRELQNLVRVACALAEGNVITMQSIPDTAPFVQYQWGGRAATVHRTGRPHEISIPTEEKGPHVTIDECNVYDSGKSWRDYEIHIIAKSYQQNNFHAARTAAELGIATATLYKRIKEWNLKDSNNPIYQDPFVYMQGIRLDDYVPRIFKAALDSVDGRAMQAIANLKVSQGYFYKVMKRASVPKDTGA